MSKYEPWAKKLKPAGQDLVNQIIEQIPEGLARHAFVAVLNQIAVPSQEDVKRIEKLEALEAHGVDNWQGYDLAMEEIEEEGEDDN